jgi:DNA primase
VYAEIEAFDTILYFQLEGIGFKSEGSDIGQGWIGVKCLWCDDPEHHLGVNQSNSKFRRNFISCWRCGLKGTIAKFIMEHRQLSFSRAMEVINSYQTSYIPTSEKSFTRPSDLSLPPSFSKEFLGAHKTYLENRRFDPDFLIKKYDLFACHVDERYSYRIVIPIKMERQILAFTARDITDYTPRPRYLNSKEEESVISPKDCVYNVDNCKGGVGLIVEGVFGTWRIGDGAVATLGTSYTKTQVRILAEKLHKEAHIMFDPEPKAQESAEKLAWELSPLVKKTTIWKLPKGEPDSLSDEEVFWIRKEIFG